MVRYQRELRKLGLWFIQRLMVHDEFLTECRINDADKVGKVMEESIKYAGRELGSICPLDGKAKKGFSWTIH